jgi:putative methionine-R-sulfoxide reductase with GAF domain
VTKGLTSCAIREKSAVVVGDVRSDPRYLTAFGSTLSEIIILIPDPRDSRVIGTIDAESESVNAFSDVDRTPLEECAQAALGLRIAT